MLASPQTTDSSEARRSHRRVRFGQRVVALFVLSALVPLILCVVLLHTEIGSELNRSQRQSLDGLVRSFGMTLLARLGSADDALRVIMTAPGATEPSVRAGVAKLPWVARVSISEPAAPRGNALPSLDTRQERAVPAGATAILWSKDALGHQGLYLVRQLSGSARLYVELSTTWLWADAKEFAGDATMTLVDDRGSLLTSTVPTPGEVSGRSSGARRRISRSWELFLASRFASPSWRLVASTAAPALLSMSDEAYLSLSGLIVFSILLITWMSLSSIRRQLHPLDKLTQATKLIAHRDFDAFRDLHWNDEFGDLAQAFRAMAGKLKAQFAALETLADVDRLLLSAPRLELILDTLLPHMAEVLRCDCVSVMLLDPDPDQSACIYDYYAAQPEHRPVREVSCDTRAMHEALSGAATMSAESALRIPCLAPLICVGVSRVQLHALKHEGSPVGVLCIGHLHAQSSDGQEFPVGGADFADRLSLILTSLRQSERLRYQANYDSLTGLQNRHLFTDSVSAAMTRAAEQHSSGALLYIDLDFFKRVNDTAGHAAGDILLRLVAERLRSCVDKDSSIARVGGDEFAVLLPHTPRIEAATGIAQRIIESLQPAIAVNGREHRIAASIGIAEFPAHGTSLEELLKAGDIAMYQAKELGRSRCVIFRPEMQKKVLARERLERGLHRALRERQLVLHYQPIVSESCGGAVGVEALARWPGTEAGTWISPVDFIPVAEENGLIINLGEWVLRSACEQFALWRRAGLPLKYISVNVSVRQLREPGYMASLLAALRDTGMQPGELQIEITESVLAHGAEVYETLKRIAEQGVHLALDDFGTGYSSLSYVHSYPFHTVKIDRTFVNGLPGDVVSCRLAESIILMCNALGMSVVAEGVETEAQRDFLRRAGCSTIQGYLVARPMEAGVLAGFIKRLAPLECAGAMAQDGSRAQHNKRANNVSALVPLPAAGLADACADGDRPGANLHTAEGEGDYGIRAPRARLIQGRD